MSEQPKICSPRVPGVGGRPQTFDLWGDQAATNERVDNIRIIPLTRGARIAGSAPRPTLRAAVERMKLWENGRVLKVAFLDGDPDVKSKVAAIAKEWEAVANLTLNFITSGPAEIRVSFKEKGFSWSEVGTDALTAAATDATVNLGWLEPTTSLTEYQRVVRHEFGHALGMIHEHQNPAAQGQIPWDKPKVYAYYAQQGWTKDDVDTNIFQVYSEDSTNHTAFDPTSIMEYAIPDSLTIGSYAVGWNTTLSQTDIEFMRRQYPKGSQGMVELTPNSPPTHADVSAGGEVDTYHFTVAATASYVMYTEGPTDTVLTLHGPNDAGAILTWDDDRGKGKNARIVRKLKPGSYWLSVKHKNPAGTGPYSIAIKTSK